MHSSSTIPVILNVLAMSQVIFGAAINKRQSDSNIADAIAEISSTFEAGDLNAENCQSNDLSIGQQSQCIRAGFLDDPSFKTKRQSSGSNELNAENCNRQDLSFGQQNQCIRAGLLDDPSQ